MYRRVYPRLTLGARVHGILCITPGREKEGRVKRTRLCLSPPVCQPARPSSPATGVFMGLLYE